jgi:hypothetical protein
MSDNKTYHRQKIRVRKTSPALLDQFLNVKPRERLLSAILEQCYVIKFLVRKQNGQKEIHLRLKAVYGDEAMKQ